MTPIPPGAYPFWYNTNLASSLSNAASTTISVRFQEGTIFELHSLFARTDLDVYTNNNSRGQPFIVKITDGGTGQELSNDYIARDAIFGSFDNVPGDLPIPVRFSGKSTLIFNITNNSGSTITTLRLTLAGVRWNGVPGMVTEMAV